MNCKIFSLLLLVIAACSSNSNKPGQEKQIAKANASFYNEIMEKYSVKHSFDSLKINFSIDFEDELGKNQMTNRVRLNDIFIEDSISYAMFTIGVPFKYIKLKISNENLQELKTYRAGSSLTGQVIVFKINKIKKIDLVLNSSYFDEESEPSVELSDHSRNFFGEGELVKIIPRPN